MNKEEGTQRSLRQQLLDKRIHDALIEQCGSEWAALAD
jgi:hypothetical protein